MKHTKTIIERTDTSWRYESRANAFAPLRSSFDSKRLRCIYIASAINWPAAGSGDWVEFLKKDRWLSRIPEKDRWLSRIPDGGTVTESNPGEKTGDWVKRHVSHNRKTAKAKNDRGTVCGALVKVKPDRWLSRTGKSTGDYVKTWKDMPEFNRDSYRKKIPEKNRGCLPQTHLYGASDFWGGTRTAIKLA